MNKTFFVTQCGMENRKYSPSFLCADETLSTVPSPSEAGLYWLMRYRRLTHAHTVLLGSPLTESLLHPPSSEFAQAHVCATRMLSAANQDEFSFLPRAADPEASFSSATNGPGCQIAAMFAKVRELLGKHDSNGPRLLCLITEELFRYPKLQVSRIRCIQ